MPADYDPNGFGSLYRYQAALFARDAARAQEVSLTARRANCRNHLPVSSLLRPRGFGEIALAQHDAAAAKAAFLDARRDFAAIYGDQPTDPFQLAALARIDAMVGRKAEAISEAKRAVELRLCLKGCDRRPVGGEIALRQCAPGLESAMRRWNNSSNLPELQGQVILRRS